MLPSLQSHVVPTAHPSSRGAGVRLGSMGSWGRRCRLMGAKRRSDRPLPCPPWLRVEVSDAPGRVCMAVGLAVVVAQSLQRP